MTLNASGFSFSSPEDQISQNMSVTTGNPQNFLGVVNPFLAFGRAVSNSSAPTSSLREDILPKITGCALYFYI